VRAFHDDQKFQDTLCPAEGSFGKNRLTEKQMGETEQKKEGRAFLEENKKKDG